MVLSVTHFPRAKNHPLELLAAFWVDLGILILRINKPLNHWPFRPQVAKQPTVSPEVTNGRTEK